MGYGIIIVVLATTLAVIFYRTCSYSEAWSDKLGESAMGLVLGALLGVLVMFVLSGLISSVAERESYQAEEKKLYAVQDTFGTEGSFFLGSGSVDGKMEYVYLTKENKGYLMQSVPVEDVFIIEDNTTKPKMTKHYERFKNDTLELIFPDLWGDTYYNITIPKGSIKYDYNIDLK